MSTLRSTDADVAGIVEVDTNTFPDLTAFRTVANELVDEVCLDKGYTSTRLQLIETWLAGHFYALRDRQSSSESAGVSVSYQAQVGLMLNNTVQGQTAMLLDTAGGLAALSKMIEEGKRGIKVGIMYLGTVPPTVAGITIQE